MSNRQLLVLFVGSGVHSGMEFSSRDWPLHLTLVPWFRTHSPFESRIRELCATAPAITVTVGEEDRFGPRNDVPVNRVTENPELRALHAKLIEALESAGAEFENTDWIGDGYNPHVTHQGERRLLSGNTFHIKDVCLIDEPTDRPGWRRVKDIYPLD